MNEHLSNTEPEISANAGWQQMSMLLNDYMPVSKRNPGKTKWMAIAASVLFTSIFLCSSLSLDITTLTNKHSFHGFTERDAQSSSIQSHLTHSLITSDDNNKTAFASRTLTTKNEKPLHGEEKNNVSDLVYANMAVAPMKNIEAEEKLTNPLQRNNLFAMDLADRTKRKPGNGELKMENGKRKKTTVDFLAGMAVNINAGAAQNPHTYPIVEAKLNVGNHFYLAAGLSVLSPMPGRVEGISKTVYINSIIDNISLYNEKKTYKNLHYADLPVSAGVNINKHLSVEAGGQVSLLLHKKTTKEIEIYDYQMNRIPVSALAPVLPMVGNNQNDYPLDIKDVDVRLSAGVHYSLDKMTVSLNYQHGLRPVGSGNVIKNNSSRFLSLQLLYPLR